MAQTILITGAGRGLGLALAHVLSHQGHTVIGTIRDDKQRDALKALGAEIETLDVSSEESIAALGTRLREPRARPTDVLINTPGVGSEQKKRADQPQAELPRVFDIN